MTTRVILIWEEVPEALKIYQIDATDDELVKLKDCHGNFINGSLSDELTEWLGKFLENRPTIYSSDDKELKQVNVEQPALIIHSGFIL